MAKKGLHFINYGKTMPGSESMMIVLEIDGEYAAKYRGYFDGNCVRCYPLRKKRHDAPGYMEVAPEVMENRFNQPIPPEHYD